MSRDDPQMKIRLPEELKARIDAEAAAANRTLNAEIVGRLTKSFEPVEGTESATPYKLALILAQRWIDNEQVREIIKQLVEPEGAYKDDRFAFFVPMLKLRGDLVHLPDDVIDQPDGRKLHRKNFVLVEKDGTETPVRLSTILGVGESGSPGEAALPPPSSPSAPSAPRRMRKPKT